MTSPLYAHLSEDAQPPHAPKFQVLSIRHPKRLEEPPIAFLVVERTERYARRCSDDVVVVTDASIRLSYQLIRRSTHRQDQPETGQFCGGYSLGAKAMSLTSTRAIKSGSVFLDLPGLEGHRIGTYLLDSIVRWAKRWPDATVSPINLLPGQADPENKDRRNTLYTQFSIEFDWLDDATKAVGTSRPMPASALTPTSKWRENIVELNVIDFIEGLLDENPKESVDVDPLLASLTKKKELTNKHPFRWIAVPMWQRHRGWLVVVGAVIFMMAIAYSMGRL